MSNSLFLNQKGLPLIDIDQDSSPFNALRYDGNHFRETTFADKVYKNTLVDLGGESVSELNRLVVPHSGGPTIDKSRVANQILGTTPRTGRLIATVSQISGISFSGTRSAPATLAYTWTGGSSAQLRTQGTDPISLSDSIGIQEVHALGLWELVVDGSVMDTAWVSRGICSDTRLCLADGRFEVTVDWRDFNGNSGAAGVVPSRTDDSGLFYFFDVDNWELMVKVLDGCALNGRYWVFSAATTHIEYTLTVLDTFTGMNKIYTNPLGSAASAVTDTDALAVCDFEHPIQPN